MKTITIWMISVFFTMLAIQSHAQKLTDDDQEFVKNAAISNMFEIRTSKVALMKTERKDVKEFAQMMVDDHTKADKELQSVLASSNLKAKVPKDLDEDHQEKLKDLKDSDAKDFDENYIEAQKDGHEKTVSMFEDYAEDGDNPALRQFASKTLPVLRQHEKRIKEIEEAK